MIKGSRSILTFAHIRMNADTHTHTHTHTHTTSTFAQCVGRDSDLYELMQALEVMPQLLPISSTAHPTRLLLPRDVIVHLACSIASLPFRHSLPQDHLMTFAVQQNASVLNLTNRAQGRP